MRNIIWFAAVLLSVLSEASSLQVNRRDAVFLSTAAAVASALSGPSPTLGFMAPSLSNRMSSAPPLQWGILGAGRISSDFAKAIAITKGAHTAAAASRSLERAEEFAARHGIPKSYGTYDKLLADPDIDVVYVGSVADQHVKLASKSILAGKATLVEKPLALNYKDAEYLVDLARQENVFLMEGMWTRCFPATHKVREMIAAGDIGKVVTLQADFGWSTASSGPNDRIWNPESGGMTLDVGMYMVQLGQVAFPNASVERVQAMGTMKNRVDNTVLANIQYSNRDNETGMLQLYMTGEANTEERVVIQGTLGRIVLDPPAHVPSIVRVSINKERGISKETVLKYPLPKDDYTLWNYPGSIGFTYEIQAVGEALRNGEKECSYYSLSDSLQVASALDSILQQVRGKD